MTAGVDQKKYARLLAKHLPRPISSEEDHKQALAEVKDLMLKGAALSTEESEIMMVLVTLIHSYEAKHFRQFIV